VDQDENLLEIDNVIFVAQQVPEPANALDRDFRGDDCHAVGTDLDDCFGDPAKAALGRVDDDSLRYIRFE
jgi:hypothetical protein